MGGCVLLGLRCWLNCSMAPEDVRLSKRMSYALRHRPDEFGIKLDSEGWVDFETFVRALMGSGSSYSISRDAIVDVIEQSDKQRFELIAGRIRAAQGHSVTVDLGLDPAVPPDELWHGTVDRFLDSIIEGGLAPQGRQHVHLSGVFEVAREVGARRGTPVVLRVDAKSMADAGSIFFQSANGVWLTSNVPAQFLTPIEAK